jgi:hypothetical protein
MRITLIYAYLILPTYRRYNQFMNSNFNKRVSNDLRSVSANNNELVNKSATLMLKSFFNPKSVLINTPLFYVHLVNTGFNDLKPNNTVQVKIHFFYYQSNQAANLTTASLNTLICALTKIY